MYLQSCTIFLRWRQKILAQRWWKITEKEGGEVQETGTDKSNFHFRTLLSPQILQQAITKQMLIKLGFVAGYN